MSDTDTPNEMSDTDTPTVTSFPRFALFRNCDPHTGSVYGEDYMLFDTLEDAQKEEYCEEDLPVVICVVTPVLVAEEMTPRWKNYNDSEFSGSILPPSVEECEEE